ncbi:MAG: hypothetical protein US86_C0003G0090 [Candidatus Daviesbacteria bacterium GW2011_GWA2_38_24]|uniref:Uncharacterized protein n=1 Tax=Candidatus Daviesbacteria bacterium GW2011_GWA2_38_24 TaxID=1618422 RepID=A0A0G0JJ51_9BACT|nr:MAG: hypothetical protein US86_C0003G0090 [Candidatus Daviesbacteria bacterium GW2011_GWA2_38_24]KKQ80232.1 MAG: hypothetical protein UT01_C0016G0013 [Candidatus Daviesbacteria bacterium GW2011_GWA1_38_7]
MQNKRLLIIVIITLFTFLFYWYELRPARIRHDCSWVQHPDDPTRWEPVYEPYIRQFFNDRTSGYYEFCIKEKGLTR